MPTLTSNLRNTVLHHQYIHYRQQQRHHRPFHLQGLCHRPQRYQHRMQTRTQEEEELLWEDLFSKPSLWLDYRRRKCTLLHPDFRHKTSKAPLWLNSMFKPHWVDSRLAVPGPGTPPEENYIRQLCEKEELDMAMDVLSYMDYDGFTPSDALYIFILKACYKCKALFHAIHISTHVMRQGMELSETLQNALIITLAKCGGLVHACSFLHMLQGCTAEAWAAVVDGLVECGRDRDALLEFLQMQEFNVKPNHNIYVSLFKACGNLGNLEEGRWLHADGEMKGFTSLSLIGTALMNMYSKCGSILEAEGVFYLLLQQGVLSWNSMLSVYLEHGFWDKVILAYRQLKEERWALDVLIYTIAVRACGFLGEKSFSHEKQPKNKGFLEIGRALHADIRGSGFAMDVRISSALITMYGKCGSISEAMNVLEGFSACEIAPWSAMLSAYVQQGQGAEALIAYRKMHELGLVPDAQTFVISLRACISLTENEKAAPEAALGIGEALHEDAQSKGFASNTSIGNTLVSMYGKCGNITLAENVFIGLPQHDVVSWNAMLSVYLQHGEVAKALQLYMQMVLEGVTVNALTFVLCIQACSILAEQENLVCKHHELKSASIQVGHALHAVGQKEGHCSSTYVCNSLISMYGKGGSLVEAENVFEYCVAVDVVSWNAMLSAYVENGRGDRALQLYTQMLEGGEYPNKLTYVIALQACIALAEQVGDSSKVAALEIGHALHMDIILDGFLSDDIICSTLVSLYGRCGAVSDAETLFNKLGLGNLVLWNAILSSYVEQGYDDEALHLLNEIDRHHMPIDEITLVCALQVCSGLGSADTCGQFYFKVVSLGFDSSSNLMNTLIHSFGHCASSVEAKAVFFQLSQPYQVAWNARIASYAQEGDFEGSLTAFQNMQSAGIMPDAFAYLSLLYACSHVGLVETSFEVFESMSRDFCLSPDIKHFSVMIDALGRTGNFKKVERVLLAMPMQANLPLWLSLLGACRTHGNLELAKEAFKQALDLQPGYAAAYVLISNIHVDFASQ